MKKDTNITHKELLTFSNLTNLEWEFVDLNQLAKNAFGEESEENLKLNDLLDPENFVRIDEEENEFGDNVNYVYGERDQNGNYIRETGLMELRQKAGIAMEYLEKLDEGNKEGDFLKDWEVVFGADKYKIMEDYLNQRWEPIRQVLGEYLNELEAQEKITNIEEKEGIQEEKKELEDFLEKKPYPSREELKPENQAKIKLQVMAKDLGINIVSTAIDGGSFTIKSVLSKTCDKFKGKLEDKSKEYLMSYIKNINVNLYLALKLWDSYESLESIEDFVDEYLGIVEEGKMENIDDILKDEGLEGLSIIEEVDMYDDARYKEATIGYGEEFRVLVLKKNADSERL